MSDIVYKIARKTEWDDAKTAGIFTGSADDKRDGFIHLSSASQVRATCAIHFAGEKDLLLVAVDAERLGPALKWEPSRKGERFPHLYGPLRLADVQSVITILTDIDGRAIFPSVIP